MSWNHINDRLQPRFCEVEGCERKHTAKGFCKYHWQNWTRHGNPSPFNFRVPNSIRVNGESATMTIYRGWSNIPIAETIFDAEDVSKIGKYKWHLVQGYVKNNRFSLSSYIMDGKWVDHINGNKLDNRKINLRFSSIILNPKNQGVQKRKKSSKYKGVCLTPEFRKSWRAYIKSDGHRFNIGRFETEEEAAWMYDQWAIELFGEYARLNHRYLPV